ncbi:MAG: sodium:proton antiporter [Myxococcales bacterium]|jgi:Na+/H+ antiporter NhaD/arsenite permease-like protein|nr:sodium:proton antiporter [Myxococcales bacterium]
MAEAHAMSLGETLPFWSIAPFALMLLGIALIPLRWPHFWESNANKGIVSAVLGVPVALYVATHDPHLLWHTTLEYVSFIALLGALFTISGGIVLRGDLRATPAINTAFLGVGALLANIIGTTGASMLLIRPLLQTNSERKHVGHIPILFIFVVSNCAGLLTPLGDPPLFLGYLRGVPFFWTLRLLPEWICVVSILLVVFYVMDGRAIAKESATDLRRDVEEQVPLHLAGTINALYLLGVVIAVLISPSLPEGPAREGVRLGVMAAMTALSLATTPQALRRENGFTFGPITEVAVLFAGIFATMIPALEILRVRGAEFGIREPWQFFWMSGILSSFLDNAPTYLTFASLAQSIGPGADTAVALAGGPVSATLLTAISAGSVLMGANSYIGNGPNFMVKAIAEEQGVAMPSFGGYLLWSVAILIPIFVVMTLVFFR